ncbi:MAG: outer membrane beta-barrel family protein, partial [Chitinophagaceae bacterium]
LFQMGVDRKIFNVEKNLVSAGQTAQEIMKNIPSVNVDIDGNVTLRNAAPQIFVDGRPSTLSLDQIPADAIESVEIITNPSAKFDASGGNAGILNIVLKKNRKTGYNGNIRAGIDSRGKVNGGADINIKQGKVNVFASANYNQRKSKSFSETFRHNITKPLVDVNQISRGINNGTFAFGRAGIDYLLDNRNTFTISGVIVNGNFNNTDNLNFDSSGTGSVFTRGNQYTDTKSSFKNYGSSFSYKHLFAKPNKDLTADVNYNSSNNENKGLYTTQLYEANSTVKGSPQLRKTTGNGSTKFFTAQFDYTDPITENSKIETGARVSVRDNTSVNNNSFYNNATQQYIFNSQLSNDYQFTDRVYAGYFTFSNKIKTLSYQAGLRAESSDYTGTLFQSAKETNFTTKYPISLFPSLFVTKELKNNQDLQINYSRRINRPNFFQLIPYTDISDPQNYSKGNPALKPEFTNSFEMSYQKTFEKSHSLLFTAYYKQSTDLITRFTYRDQVTTNSFDSAYFTTYLNANSSKAYGLELTSRNPIAKWWDMTTNFNFYNSKINGSNIDNSLQSQRLSYFVKWNSTFKLPANFSIQLSGDYQSKSVLPQSSGGGGGRSGGGFSGGGWGGGQQPSAQGYINPNYGVDAAIRKDFLKNKTASITLSVNDILRTKRYSYYSESSFFTQEYERRRDPQVFRLNFSYRFGKLDVSLFKRKNMRNGMDTPDVQMGQ